MDDDEAFERLGDVMAMIVVGDVWQMADAALKADDEQRRWLQGMVLARRLRPRPWPEPFRTWISV